MHGIKEINFQNEHKEAERILANAKVSDVDRDWLIRQEALDNYLKAKYGNRNDSL
jgi:hypothetical protein